MTVFLMPLYNDYESAFLLIESISKFLKYESAEPHLFIVVDDASIENESEQTLANLPNVKILKLKIRSGSQKAIHYGLRYVIEQKMNSNVVILDSDGEDAGEDAFSLSQIGPEQDSDVVMVTRGKRVNNLRFRILLTLYYFMFKVFTGVRLRSGNFMWISATYLDDVVKMPQIESHVSAAILRYGRKKTFIEYNRQRRLKGKSKMNWTSLLTHAYGSFTVFADLILARLLFLISAILFIIIIFFLIIFALRVTGFLLIFNGWTTLVSLQLISLIITLMFLSLFTLILFLQNANGRNVRF